MGYHVGLGCHRRSARRPLAEDRGGGRSYGCVFSPDGDLVAAASHNSQIRLYAADTGDLVRTLKGHTDAVQSVQFSRDGNWLVSGGADRTVRIWDVETGQLLSTFVNPTARSVPLHYHRPKTRSPRSPMAVCSGSGRPPPLRT